MRQRTIVCPLIQNDGAYLLCKMADDRGVFPGQWAISGGGVEPGERIEEALRREIREELGEQLLLTEITPWNPVTKVADKCDFCAESRLAKGFPPICVSACPEHALIFGREDSPEIQAWLQDANVINASSCCGA